MEFCSGPLAPFLCVPELEMPFLSFHVEHEACVSISTIALPFVRVLGARSPSQPPCTASAHESFADALNTTLLSGQSIPPPCELFRGRGYHLCRLRAWRACWLSSPCPHPPTHPRPCAPHPQPVSQPTHSFSSLATLPGPGHHCLLSGDHSGFREGFPAAASAGCLVASGIRPQPCVQPRFPCPSPCHTGCIGLSPFLGASVTHTRPSCDGQRWGNCGVHV